MMKPQNQKRAVLPDMLRHKSPLRGVGGTQGGRLGTTIFDDDPKDWDKTRTKNVSLVQISLIVSRTY